MPSASEPSAVLAARSLADALLRPQAESVDVSGVPRSHLDAVAAAGLYGPLEPAVSRAVVELLAGADGSTWFVTAQHALPLLQAGAAGHPRLPGLVDGSTPAGVAFAHLRRSPCPVTATRVDGGWRFDGTVDWTSGWGLVDLLLLGGRTPSGELVFALLPAVGQPGLAASAPLQLSAMQATQTVRLTLTGVRADDADVTLVVDAAEWLEADRLRTANAGPHTVGLVREAVDRLAQTGERRGEAAASALAVRLGERGEQLRAEAYRLVDDVDAAECVPERLAVRAALLELAVRATTALVTAVGGSATSRTSAPQRLAREATFHLVQAQTPAVREATLRRLAEL